MDHDLISAIEGIQGNGDGLLLMKKSNTGEDEALSAITRDSHLLQAYTKNKLLLTIPYESVTEYLYLLEHVAREVEYHAANRAMFYLAAAVSDFYVPRSDMHEHKIQSRDENMRLDLKRVPKCLGLLTQCWAPNAYVVSFKLETDEALVVGKAQRAIHDYGVHLVVANQLQTRRNLVQLVDESSVTKIEKGNECRIDDKLVDAVVERFLSPDRLCQLAPALIVDAVDGRREKHGHSDINANSNPKHKVAGLELSTSELNSVLIGIAALVGVVVGRLSKRI